MFFLQLTTMLLYYVLLVIIGSLRKKDHIRKFRNCIPNVSENFQRPNNARRKSNYVKILRTSPNPDILIGGLGEVSASTNNSSSQPIVIAEKESVSQPSVTAESIIYDIQDNI